jgi:hypothetical protein
VGLKKDRNFEALSSTDDYNSGALTLGLCVMQGALLHKRYISIGVVSATDDSGLCHWNGYRAISATSMNGFDA